MLDEYVRRILCARVYDVAIESPITEARQLSSRYQNRILLKREDLQEVYSFKIRGAYNKIAQLSPEQMARGVVTASAGNHAQGVALSATRLGIKATIVMPRTTPQIKVDGVRGRGGKVVLHGDTYDEASAHAVHLAETQGMAMIPAYDDVDVIAGQGTIGMEILRQWRGPLDAIFLPVGGGGLCAGVAAYVKYLRPEIRIIAVEPEDAACLKAALAAGRRVTLPQVGLFADGVAVAQIGKEPFRILRNIVDDVVTVTTDEICAAIKHIFDDTRSISEPAGALALAGLTKYIETSGVTGETLLAVESGANTNFDRLRYIAERTEIGEQREAVLAVTIPEKPGSFKAFCTAIGRRNITEFNYRLGSPEAAHIFLGVQVSPGGEDREALVSHLQERGYDVLDLTDDEMAKLHIRHMVGGRAQADHEVLYRFEFPERPGALAHFLSRLGARWNISLFHYRNHGAAYGRVLLGLQVPPKERAALRGLLTEIGYLFTEETGNPAYRLFLGRDA
ncbi:MAG: threonine ammonia-lyase, biosynthetic [Spongiibacteraceae bacterium]|jgi:threonine dehydratase|nr:threonine ammonia-lyase, biosynthetic [Spongiibacteraceae bacterium]